MIREELISKLANATGPSLELDNAIWLVCCARPEQRAIIQAGYDTFGEKEGDYRLSRLSDCFNPTHSIDAAFTLFADENSAINELWWASGTKAKTKWEVVQQLVIAAIKYGDFK